MEELKVTKTQAQCRVYDESGYRLRAEAICFRDQSRQQVLLVKCRKTETWKFPGGGIEPNETSTATAIRELMEEGGVSGHIMKKTGVFENCVKKIKTHVYVMIANEEVVDWQEKDWRLTKWCTIAEVLSILKKESAILHIEKLLDDSTPDSSGSE